MRVFLLAASFLTVCLHMPAHADPTGRHQVRGSNADNGDIYTGTVSVTRNGETYKVVWKIGDTEFVGTGLGARLVDGIVTIGPASGDDTVISVAYGSGDTFGNAFYVRQPDGTWRGHWAYDGEQRVALEEWIPEKRNQPVSPLIEAADKKPLVRKLQPNTSRPMPARAGPKS